MTPVAPMPPCDPWPAAAVVILLGLRRRRHRRGRPPRASGIVAPLILALVITIDRATTRALRMPHLSVAPAWSAVWSWVLGPLGALLAVPMSLLVRDAFLDADPDSNWLRPLVANRPDDPPGSEPGRHEAEVTGATRLMTDRDSGAGLSPRGSSALR